MQVTGIKTGSASAGNLAAFTNLFARESRKWWRTRRWWIQTLLWLVILNGFVAFGLFVMPGLIAESSAAMNQPDAEVMSVAEFQRDVPMMLFGLASFLLPIGVIILVQSQVYAEKQSGVAAWILSKPVSRATYLLAKLAADGLGVVLIMIALQMTIAYLLLSSVLSIALSDFLIAIGLLTMLLIFYLTFTLMMSVIGNSSEIVLGVSMGMLLGGMVLKDVLARILGDLIFLTPWVLPDAINLTVMGQSLPAPLNITVIAVPILTLLCLIVMFWQFRRQEL